MKRWIQLALSLPAVLGLSCIAVISIAQHSALDFPVGVNIASEFDPLPERQVVLDDATVLADITYSTLPGFRPLRLDLYRATSQTTPRPLVIFAHGGGWTIGQKRGTADFTDFPGVLAGLAKRGYVVASLEYRLSGEAPFPAAVQDVKAAIRFLRANATRYGIQPDQVALWGPSAGSHLAAMAAYSCNVGDLEPEDTTHREESDCVQGFVGWYGPYDLNILIGNILNSLDNGTGLPTDNVALMGGLSFFRCTVAGCPPDILTQASPITYITPNAPPTLLIHGTRDGLVPASQSEQLAKRLQSVGTSAEVLLIPEVDHGFRGATQPITRDACLQALSATFAFFDQIFAKR